LRCGARRVGRLDTDIGRGKSNGNSSGSAAPAAAYRRKNTSMGCNRFLICYGQTVRLFLPVDRVHNGRRRCGSRQAPSEQKMVEDLHRQRVLNFLDAFYSGDTAAALACCDENFDSITHAPIELFPHLGHKHGKDWVAEAIRTQQKRYSSRKYEIKFLSVDGDKVATIQFLSLRKRNDDRVIHLEVAEFFTLRGGRILVHRSFFDSFDFVQQLLGQDLTDTFAVSVRDAMPR